MSLIRTDRWEHALIGATVAAATQACPQCYLGRTALQKLLYFMKVLDVPMRYDFEVYNYGPFCSTVLSDVDWLLADNVIEDQSGQPRYSNYWPGAEWPQLESRYQDKLNQYAETVTDIAEALSGLPPEKLELIATLDFCYRWVRARGGKGPWKSDAIEKFKRFKKDKFTEQELDRWYGVLVEAGLIES